MSPTTTMPSPSTIRIEPESSDRKESAAVPSAKKLLVRPRLNEALTAVLLTKPTEIVLPNGLGQTAQPGEWLIYRGPRVIDRMIDKTFHQFYEPVVSGLIVCDATMGTLEELLGPGSTINEAALVRAVQRVVEIKIGGVDVKFSPGQLEEIANRAAKNNRTVQEEVERVVAHLSGDVFWTA